MTGLANELELEVALHRVVLRDFDYMLTPVRPLVARVSEYVYLPPNGGPEPLDGNGTDGIELRVKARDTGLEVLLRFERGEFVNVATAGLAMLDAADATDQTEGREN